MFFLFPTLLEIIIDPWLTQAIYITLITVASINMMQSLRKKIIFALISLLAFSILWGARIFGGETRLYEVFVFGSFTIYFSTIAYNLFKQMRKIKTVDESMVIASITGYLLIATNAFLAFCFIEMTFPGSFTNTQKILTEHRDVNNLLQMTKYSKHVISDLFYFSFISISTIGYGDIAPVSQAAKKAVIILGIAGPFYMAIVVATMVGKFMTSKNT